MLKLQQEIHLAAAFEGKPVWDYKSGFAPRSGLRFLNFEGLLNFLEMELGLSSWAPERFNRMLRWWHTCQTICQNSRFSDFNDAFQNDGIAVANTLLKWRDFLVLSGWKPTIQLDGNEPKVLRSLKLIDAHFRNGNTLYRGEADRWQELISVISEPGFRLPDSLKKQKLVCHDPEDTLCPAYQKALKMMEGMGLRIEFRLAVPSARNAESNLYRVQDFLLNGTNSTSESPLSAIDDSFRIIDFQGFASEEEILAYALNSKLPALVIARHDEFLKAILQRQGHSSSFGLKVGYPGGTQFLHCVGKLVFCPVWKDSITSFLINTPCPIPRSLSRELVKHLEGGGNFGHVWDNIIDKWFQSQNEAGNNNWNGLSKEDLLRFLPYQNNYGERDTVPVSELLEQYERVVRWAENRRQLPDTIALYSAIREAAVRMSDFLKLWSEPEISLVRFEKAAKRLLLAAEIKSGEKEAGSPDVIQDPGTLLGEVHSLYWAGFAGGNPASSVYQEIGPGVHAFLKEMYGEAYLPETPSITRKREWHNCVRAIAKASDRCCLIMPRLAVKENGVHALYPELQKLKGLKKVRPLTVKEEYEAIAGIDGPLPFFIDFPAALRPYFTRKEYFPLEGFDRWLLENISSTGGKHRLKTSESPSSLDKLIQHPMEWLLKKLSGFNVNNPDNFSNTNRAEGNAFHRFAELVFVGNGEKLEGLDLKAFKPAEKDQWKRLLQQSVLEKSSELLLPQHRLEHSKFCKDAMKAMECLCRFIEKNGFNRIGIENSFCSEMPDDVPVAMLNGKIDMILAKADSDENLNGVVVLDLKWSGSQEKFEKWVADNDAVQLAVYARFVPEARSLSYLLLPDMVLVGADHQQLQLPFGMSIADPEVIFNQDRAINVQQKLWESVRFRLNEIMDGRIETGDDFFVSKLDYGKSQKGRLISFHHTQSKKQASYSDRMAVLLEEHVIKKPVNNANDDE
jgi:hypothetical protein